MVLTTMASKWGKNVEYTEEMTNWVLARPYTMAKSFKQKFPMTGHRASHILFHMKERGLIVITNKTKKRILYQPVVKSPHDP